MAAIYSFRVWWRVNVKGVEDNKYQRSTFTLEEAKNILLSVGVCDCEGKEKVDYLTGEGGIKMYNLDTNTWTDFDEEIYRKHINEYKKRAMDD